MLKFIVGALCLTAACSSRQAPEPTLARRTDAAPQPRLTIATADHPVQPGVMLLAPSITGGDGQVVARASRHGSQCATDVRGSVTARGDRLDIHIQYVPREGVMCSQIARVLEYTATVSDVPAGHYTVRLYQTDDSGPDHEVQSQQVTVR